MCEQDRPTRGRQGQKHLPEGPAVERRLIPDDGKHGGQHAEEQHEQQHGQVEVVGPARNRQPCAEFTHGQAPVTYGWSTDLKTGPTLQTEKVSSPIV